VDERRERLQFWLALTGCLVLAVGGAWVRWKPVPVAVIAERGDLTVHVEGAVGRPGTYRLAWGSRVDDLLVAAGGLVAEADPALVARAAALTDGATVVVPVRSDAAGDGRIDVNAASERLLATLPGVGPVTAARIVAARPFHAIDDLLRVPGIGPVRLEVLRPWVTLGGG
jgi:competence protein ComEA